MSRKTSLASPDYRNFGPEGPEFHRVFHRTWTAVNLAWGQSLSKFDTGLGPEWRSLNRALQYGLDESASWYERISAISALESSFDASALAVLWGRFRQIFSPALLEGSEYFSGDRYNLLEWLMGCHSPVVGNPPIHETIGQLNRVCFGPFDQEEMRYLLRHAPRLVELGSGAGYFAWCFAQSGGDIVAIDNDRYNYLSRRELPEWTKYLYEQGLQVEGGVETLSDYSDRTLLISWPEPGSSFPADALEAYHQAGGERFLFKIGGFIGRQHQRCGPTPGGPQNPGQNVIRFFDVLIRDWQEDTEAPPPYYPKAVHNGLCAFRRK